MRELRQVWRLLQDLFRAVVWIAITVWLGARATWRIGVLVCRSQYLVARHLSCGRGHRVPVYGAYVCSSCHAAYEGYAFRPCPNCGQRPGWVQCPRCRLAVRNPWR